MKSIAFIWSVLLALSLPLSGFCGTFEAGDVYTTSTKAETQQLTRNGEPLAELLRGSDGTLSLHSLGVSLAEIRTSRETGAYPKRVKVEARTERDFVQMSYVEVAPAFPIQVEAEDEGFGAYAAEFKRETGRDLRLGYEVSGRTRDGQLVVNGTKVASFYTAFQRNKDGSYKEHHRGDTLEHADVISYGPQRAFVAYRCGCHGFSEYNPRMVVGGYEYSIELKSNGELINIGKGKLFRKPRKFIIRDAHGKSFGGIDIGYNGNEMDQATYRFFTGSLEIARATIDGSNTKLELNKTATDAIEKLDTVLALLPTQIIRGDGVRDSRLGQVETMLDWIRFIAKPGAERLADVVSKTDVATAPRKSIEVLSANASRFKANRPADEAPPGVICTPDGCRYLPEAR